MGIGALVLVLGIGAGTARAQEPARSVRQAAAFEAERGRGAALLSEIAAQVPEGLQLRAIAQRGQHVTVRGWSPDNERIARLLSGLEESGWIDSVYLVSIQAQEVDGVTFKEFEATLRHLLPAVEEGLDERVTDPEWLGGRVAELARRMPPHDTVEYDQRRKAFRRAVEKAGVETTRWMPGVPEVAGGWERVQTGYEVVGEPAAVLRVLRHLAGLHAPLVSRDLQLTVVDGTSPVQVRMAATSTSYGARPAGTPPGEPEPGAEGPAAAPYPAVDEARLEGIGPAFGDFVQAAAAERRSTPALRRWSLQDYTIRSIDCVRQLAVLRDPDGADHEVSVGTVVGYNWGVASSMVCPELVVTEEFQTAEGETVVSEARLQIRGEVTAPDPEP